MELRILLWILWRNVGKYAESLKMLDFLEIWLICFGYSSVPICYTKNMTSLYSA